MNTFNMIELKCSDCGKEFKGHMFKDVKCPRCGSVEYIIYPLNNKDRRYPTAEELLDACECQVESDIGSASILQTAERLVHGERNADYGNPWEDYERTVGAFKALMGDKKISEMTPEDGMMFMVCVKLSRQINAPKRDNLVDAAGYLECIQWTIDQNSPDLNNSESAG